ncbi:hypothetical protein [Tenacibaculum sp. 190130A14a]|uniref:helix-turn-helix transcriptional regulator n=1 Tax=Tenacibaculum polynesiense TaxID=3137857 RepID=UPI0032B25000
MSLVSARQFAQTKIIKFGDEWKYYDRKEPPESGWENSSRITSSWNIGSASFGYGNKQIVTNISYGDDPKNKITTTYFTKSFTIDDPYKYVLYRIQIEKDDGMVLYLNGREICRKDMPLGKITHDTKASRVIVSEEEEEFLHTVFLSPEDLNAGSNIVSVSVHQGQRISMDLFFDLEFVGSNDVEMFRFLAKERTIKNLNLSIKLKDIQYQQDYEKIIFEKELLKQKNSSYKVYLTVALVLFFVTVLGLIQVWKIYRVKNSELISVNLSLKGQNQIKGAEMINISLNALNNKQLLKNIKKDLEESLKESGLATLKREVNKVINVISYNIDSTEDWENLKKHFNVVHSGYVDKLTELHPSLTDVELRHCIFIKLHMQTKEIANILHIDPRSVQSSRYRIKKKMGLDESINLKEYLISIS